MSYGTTGEVGRVPPRTLCLPGLKNDPKRTTSTREESLDLSYSRTPPIDDAGTVYLFRIDTTVPTSELLVYLIFVTYDLRLALQGIIKHPGVEK